MTDGQLTSLRLQELLVDLVPMGMAVKALPVANHLDAIFNEERQLVERAVAKRQREFSTGRRCAHLSLSQLGHGSVPILRGERGRPIWPHGVIGSLAHCAEVAVAVVGPGEVCRSVGIDVEPDAPLDPKLARRICAPGEEHPHAALRRVFCAKEAFYKWQFPLTHKYLGFHGARVAIEAHRFQVELLQRVGDLPVGLSVEGDIVGVGGVVAASITW